VRRVSYSSLSRTDLIHTIVEFATVGKTKDGKIYHHLWGADEITALLKEHNLAKDENAEGDRIVT
jgi:20S proteasome subunit alpha 3